MREKNCAVDNKQHWTTAIVLSYISTFLSFLKLFILYRLLVYNPSNSKDSEKQACFRKDHEPMEAWNQERALRENGPLEIRSPQFSLGATGKLCDTRWGEEWLPFTLDATHKTIWGLRNIENSWISVKIGTWQFQLIHCLIAPKDFVAVHIDEEYENVEFEREDLIVHWMIIGPNEPSEELEYDLWTEFVDQSGIKLDKIRATADIRY
ncbi:hypothetical protein L596_011516 [Steinernema carpocapsae]|nr:hypothetical protein L596_011516 [Steinernema carpocapsae]